MSELKDQVAERAEDVKGRAAEAVEAGKSGVGEVAQTASEKAHEVVQETARQARDLVGEARTQVTAQASDQRDKLVSSIRALSEEFGEMSRQSGSSGSAGLYGSTGQSGNQSGLANELVSQAHERLESVVGWLENKQPGEVLDEVRSFARNRPGAFLFGAVLAGVAVGRMTRGVVAAHGENSQQSATSAGTPSLPPASSLPTTPSAPPTSGATAGSSATAQTTLLPSVPDYEQGGADPTGGTAAPSTADVGYHSTTPRGNGYSGGAS